MDVSNQTNRDIVVPSPADKLPMTGDSRKFLSFTLFFVFFSRGTDVSDDERREKILRKNYNFDENIARLDPFTHAVSLYNERKSHM